MNEAAPLYQLIYVSQARTPCDAEDLAAILGKSREYNTRDGITGLLIYKLSPAGTRGGFMQLLEGDKQKVLDAFGRIRGDRRHHTKVVLYEDAADRRSFPDWSMGFRDLDESDLAGHEGYADLGSDEFWERAKAGELSGPLSMMASFYEDNPEDD